MKHGLRAPAGTGYQPASNVPFTSMRVLVTGATGLLGAEVVSAFRREPGADVVGLGHHELDVTDEGLVRSRFETLAPDLVIHCAAYTKVDDCEANEAHALKVNGDGAGHVAAAARASGAALFHISTDYVFDGKAQVPYSEDHPPAAPERLSAYGRSKLLGEELVRREHPEAVVVRTAWLFGNGPCFPQTILERARRGEQLRVVTDQVGSPTYAHDLARALVELAHDEVSGVYHITNTGQCSWHEFAVEILRAACIDAAVEPIRACELDRPARRPAYSVLDNRRYRELAGRPLRAWEAAVEDYLKR